MSTDEHNCEEAPTGAEACSRRDFLVRGSTTLAVAASAAGFAWWLYDPSGKAGLSQPRPRKLDNYFAEIDYPVDAPRLSIARGPDERIDRMVSAALGGLGGMERFIHKGDKVLVKPNVGFQRDPRIGATTNPEVLRHIIKECFQAGAAEVVVTDNPIENPQACFAKTGIERVAKEEGARILLPSKAHFEPITAHTNPDGSPRQPKREKSEALGAWPVLWTPLRDADKVIGVAPVKDHNLCSASLGMKNWYGLLGGRRNQFHQAIHEIISDLGLLVSPTLSICDGTRVLMRNGPTGGSLADVRMGNTIIAAVDQIACDAYAYQQLLGRDPAQLTYLELAEQKFGETPDRPYEKTRRFGRRDWTEYKRQGKIAETNV